MDTSKLAADARQHFFDRMAAEKRGTSRPTAVQVIRPDRSEYTASLATLERDGDFLTVLSLYTQDELKRFEPGTWRSVVVWLRGEKVEEYVPTVHEFDETDLAIR